MKNGHMFLMFAPLRLSNAAALGRKIRGSYLPIASPCLPLLSLDGATFAAQWPESVAC